MLILKSKYTLFCDIISFRSYSYLCMMFVLLPGAIKNWCLLRHLRNVGFTKRFRCTFNFSSALALVIQLWLVFYFNFSHSTYLMYVTTFVYDDGKIAVTIHGFVAVCSCWNFLLVLFLPLCCRFHFGFVFRHFPWKSQDGFCLDGRCI